MTGCFIERNTPFYDSEWVMQNYDENGGLYYHHLILQPGHKAMLRVSYADSTNIIVWTGTYKINSKNILAFSIKIILRADKLKMIFFDTWSYFNSAK